MTDQSIPDLQSTFNLYNNIVLGSLIFAGVVAIVIAAFSVLSSRKSDELMQAKDRQLTLDLKDKDLQIEQVKSKALADKNESDSKIAESKTEIARAKEAAAKASQLAAEANKAAEQERTDRLKLEAQIAPRRLNTAQQQLIARACSRLTLQRVQVVSYSMDAEAGVLAKQIISSLQGAGLNVEDATASVMPLGGFSLGIHITGSDQILVTSLSAILSSVGNLVVAPPNSPQSGSPTISTGTLPDRNTLGASILVGVKPITN